MKHTYREISDGYRRRDKTTKRHYETTSTIGHRREITKETLMNAEDNTKGLELFWAGKRDLVAGKFVVQPPCLGGFSMINVQSKVHALHVQWVRRFLCPPFSWVSFLNFWFRSCFSSSPSTVFSSPSRFIPSSLPPSYAALLDAWYACHGSFYPHAGVGLGITFQPLSFLSTKAAYLYLLSELASSSHCVEKFLPSFGPL